MTHVSRRAFVRGAVALSVVPSVIGHGCPAHAQSGRGRPFAGKTLNVFTFDHPYPRALKSLLPGFTEATGIKVEMDTPSFMIYNQRADLELSTGSGAFDVMALTFIFSGQVDRRGVGDAAQRPHRARRCGGFADFLPGAMAPKRRGGDVLALPFVAESTLMVYRKDVLEKAGAQAARDLRRPPRRRAEAAKRRDKAYLARGLGRLSLDLAELPPGVRRSVLRRSAP